MQEHVVRDVGRARELLSQPGSRRGSAALVGVDLEDPLATGMVESVVPGGSKVVDPLEVEDARSALSCDPLGSVGRSRIDDDHLIDEPAQRAQAAVEISRFVLDDQARGEDRPWPGWLDPSRTPAE